MATKDDKVDFGKDGDPSELDAASEGIVIAGPAEGIRFEKHEEPDLDREPTKLDLPGTEVPAVSPEDVEVRTDDVLRQVEERAKWESDAKEEHPNHQSSDVDDDSHIDVDIDHSTDPGPDSANVPGTGGDDDVDTGSGDVVHEPPIEMEDYPEEGFEDQPPPDPFQRGADAMEGLGIDPPDLTAGGDVLFDG